MQKSSLLKPIAMVVASAIIATAASVYISANYFKPQNYTKDEIGKVAAEFLVQHPDYLLKAGEALETNKVSASIQALIPFAPALFETAATPSLGPADADVAVIEFFDYLCHYCQQVTPVVEQSFDQSKGVKFFFKEFPIFAGSKPVSGMSSATGLYIFKKYGAEAYHKFHNNLMAVTGTFLRSQKTFTENDLKMVIDKSGFEVSMTDDDKKYFEEIISINMQLGEKLGINGTPGFIIMNMKNPTALTTTFIPGATDLSTLQAAISKARGQ
ncbi:DsbA family protein [Buttiauxella gaviniae]|uniref:DsbA family protein n=1 Tax=Buttiauxella gaviniae TaxID=82990 RepID=UPI0039B084AD